jgi:hypothetical protein
VPRRCGLAFVHPPTTSSRTTVGRRGEFLVDGKGGGRSTRRIGRQHWPAQGGGCPDRGNGPSQDGQPPGLELGQWYGSDGISATPDSAPPAEQRQVQQALATARFPLRFQPPEPQHEHCTAIEATVDLRSWIAAERQRRSSAPSCHGSIRPRNSRRHPFVLFGDPGIWNQWARYSSTCGARWVRIDSCRSSRCRRRRVSSNRGS